LNNLGRESYFRQLPAQFFPLYAIAIRRLEKLSSFGLSAINRTINSVKHAPLRGKMPFEQSNNSVKTDIELYLALKSGSNHAFGIIYDRHGGLVYGVALKILGNAQEAEDLTQDVFISIAKGSTYEPSRGSLRTFLAILTRSRAIDRVRSRNSKRKVLGQLQDNQQQTVTDAPFAQVSRSEQSQEVRNAISQLSDEQQQILQMAYYDGLSQSEIANQLQVPLGTVKARARRGLLKLRQALVNYIG
jgi:RNA polymerase sigma-70 factor, ECF subfamily